MKKMKRLLAICLALVMCMGMTVTAFATSATQPTTGTITISNATKDQVYKAYKIFDANVGSDSIAYTITKEQKDVFDAAVEAHGKVSPFSFVSTASGTYIVEMGVKKPAEMNGDQVVDPEVKYSAEDVTAFFSKTVEETDGAGNKVEKTVIDEEFLSKIDATPKTATAESATVKFENVPYGYYVITSTLGATLTVNSTNPDAVVIDKNQTGPSWDDNGKGKVIVDATTGETTQINSANYGDVIDFKITLNTTNYDGTEFINNYYIQDKLSEGFTYVNKGSDGTVTDGINVTVKVGEKILAASEYTVEEVKYTDANDKSTGFVVNIPWVETKKENDVETVVKDENGNPKFLYDSPNKIVITYSARVNENAVIDGVGADKNTNTASYAYTKQENFEKPDPEEEYDEKTSTTETYVFALAINKVDPNGNPLEGAEFTVALKGTTNTPIWVKPTDEDGVYVKSAEGVDGSVSKVTTPENGVIVIKGVAEGEYVLTETKAPLGYNLLKESVSVKPTVAEKNTYTTTTYYKVVNGVVEELESAEDATSTVTTTVPVKAWTVVNNQGSLLPSTGGIGTTIFYVVGGVLVAAAGILLITKKRMSKEQ